MCTDADRVANIGEGTSFCGESSAAMATVFNCRFRRISTGRQLPPRDPRSLLFEFVDIAPCDVAGGDAVDGGGDDDSARSSVRSGCGELIRKQKIKEQKTKTKKKKKLQKPAISIRAFFQRVCDIVSALAFAFFHIHFLNWLAHQFQHTVGAKVPLDQRATQMKWRTCLFVLHTKRACEQVRSATLQIRFDQCSVSLALFWHERAERVLVVEHVGPTDELWQRKHDIAIENAQIGTVWRSTSNQQHVVRALGAPELERALKARTEPIAGTRNKLNGSNVALKLVNGGFHEETVARERNDDFGSRQFLCAAECGGEHLQMEFVKVVKFV